LQDSLPTCQAQGLNIAAISYDSQAVLGRFAAKYNITYPLLSDTDSQVIRRFGLFNPNMPEGTFLYGVPFPGIYLLDATGRVLAKSFVVDHTNRTTAISLLMQHRPGISTADRIEIPTEDLRLTVQLSSPVVRPGQNVLLRVQLDINPELHIYGSEVPEGYLPTSLRLDTADWLLEPQVHYPSPQPFHIAVLNETLPVYTGTVVIEGDAFLKRSVSPGEYRLRGVLRYQACTDAECYLPTDVPFELPLQVEPTVAQVPAS
jgi:hypothetical protein